MKKIPAILLTSMLKKKFAASGSLYLKYHNVKFLSICFFIFHIPICYDLYQKIPSELKFRWDSPLFIYFLSASQ